MKNPLKAVTSIFSPVERAKSHRKKLEAERGTVVKDIEATKQRTTAAAVASINGDANADRLSAEAFSAQDKARQRLAQIDALIRAVDEQIAMDEARAATGEHQNRRARAFVLLRQHEKESHELQREVEAVARRYAGMEALRLEAIGLLPELRERLRRLPEGWQSDVPLRIAIEQQLLIASEGLLGDPRAYGMGSLGELRRDAENIPAVVARSHRQFMGEPIPESTPAEAA